MLDLAVLFFVAAIDAGPEQPLQVQQAPKPASSLAQQEALLSRAVFLVQRDACVLVEPDALTLQAYGFDRKGAVSVVKTEVARCEPHANVGALIHAFSVALVSSSNNEAPAVSLPPFNAIAIDAAAFALTGKKLLVSASPEKNVYDAGGVKALFDALYAKPDDVRLGKPMRAVYQATIRDAVIRIRDDVNLLMAKPNVLASEAKKAATAKDTGKDAWRLSLNKLVKSDDDAARIDPRLVGFVLRRHNDGTLPVVVDILKTVTADYQ